jgi:hypothetical protein
VDILIENIMLKICVVIVIIDMEEKNNHGIVSMINYMLMVYAKIAILIDITR